MLIILLIALLLFSFIVSGAEVAYFSLSDKDINILKTKQQSSYKRVVDLLEEPKTLLASLLIANSFFNIAIIIISNILLDGILSQSNFAVWLDFVIKIGIKYAFGVIAKVFHFPRRHGRHGW